jgi:hypothetical protein
LIAIINFISNYLFPVYVRLIQAEAVLEAYALKARYNKHLKIHNKPELSNHMVIEVSIAGTYFSKALRESAVGLNLRPLVPSRTSWKFDVTAYQ